MTSNVVFGCTGLVGSNILSTLLTCSPATTVTISRRPPKSSGPNLNAIIEADTTQWASKLKELTPTPTTVFSGLGTTRAQAGSIANQWKIDHDLNVELARAAKEAGVRQFVFISSAGTRGLFSSAVPYSRMKQGVEDAIKGLEFETAIIVRPGFIFGEREVKLQGAAPIGAAIRGLGKVFGQWAQDKLGQEAEVIARAAVHAARIAKEGKAPAKFWVLEQSDVVRLGRTEWKD
ncbi:hypothetical protein C8A03DRAFT_18296 [Achaetomium macrosporum]|uniref:NAD-dependent epimerase/dehydratase domain-containing protein n=1 Tax=Achaetomium macrosporum TaxID=79813 RepID=A0AAN7HBH1_9PEZI|nr:hypothetical protein C8A03DRAFT_18296 [Achaetomium macrosporum]